MMCGATAIAVWANPITIATCGGRGHDTYSDFLALSTRTRRRTTTTTTTIAVTTTTTSLTNTRSSISDSSNSFYLNFNKNRMSISHYYYTTNKNNKKKKKKMSTSYPPYLILMQWQDCKVKMDVDVPISVAYKCYSDREAIPRWMPFISTVKILEDKPDLSRWSLKYKAFGQLIEFSWLARNMQPIPNQKIHWRSLEGLPNKGAVRFYPKGPSSCTIELTVSYEVPQLLVPVASALQPFLESLLARGLERFAKFAGSYSST